MSRNLFFQGTLLAALLLLSSNSFADPIPVDYSIRGTFGTPTVSVTTGSLPLGAMASLSSSNSEIVYSEGSSTLGTLQFGGIVGSVSLSPGQSSIVDFGPFLLTGTTDGTTITSTFSLNISQSSPSSGSGSTSGSLSGTFTVMPGTSGNSTVTLTFGNGSAVDIGNVTYIPQNLTFVTTTGGGPLNGEIILSAQADTNGSSAPLPASMWTGLGLFGLVGASRIRKAIAAR